MLPLMCSCSSSTVYAGWRIKNVPNSDDYGSRNKHVFFSNAIS